MLRRGLLCIFLVLLVPILSACNQDGKTFGGNRNDGANDIQATSDGGFVVAGYTRSFGYGGTDFWIMKLDPDGNQIWEKFYGTSSYETASVIQQTADGGYIIAGRTQSFGYKAKYWDFLILKIDAEGTEEWWTIFGGDGYEKANSIDQTSDGGYIIAGVTTSVAGTTTPFGTGLKHNTDSLVLKLNADGDYQWHHVYDGTNGDAANSVQQTDDDGYIIAGYSKPINGSYDFLVMKLDRSGVIDWVNTYGESNTEKASSVRQTADGGFIVAGDKRSIEGNSTDFWVIKLDSQGNSTWSESYGGEGFERAKSIRQTPDNGFIVAGNTNSYGAGDNDFWILKLNSFGEKEWSKAYGYDGFEVANSICLTEDGGYTVAGNIEASKFDGLDFWILKLTSSGEIASEWKNPFSWLLRN